MSPCRFLSLFPLVLLSTFGCGDSSNEAHLAVVSQAEIPDSGGEPASVQLTEAGDRKIVRTAELVWKTEDRGATRQQLQAMIQESGGWIADDTEERLALRIEQTMTARIPVSQFDSFLDGVAASVDFFDVRRMTASDVTEVAMDLTARLNVARQSEGRYLELLKSAQKVSEMLEIEVELNRLRADIEAAETRLNGLQNRIAFSTVQLRFYESVPASVRFGTRLLDNVKIGWRGLIEFLIAVALLWPLLCVAAVVGFVVRYRSKRRANSDAIHSR
ncbi:MAG: DUF4349 domain-containing protein [Planctomycetaceae bacterium]